MRRNATYCNVSQKTHPTTSQCNSPQRNTTHLNTMQCSSTQRGATQCNARQHKAVKCRTAQCNKAQPNGSDPPTAYPSKELVEVLNDIWPELLRWRFLIIVFKALWRHERPCTKGSRMSLTNSRVQGIKQQQGKYPTASNAATLHPARGVLASRQKGT